MRKMMSLGLLLMMASTAFCDSAVLGQSGEKSGKKENGRYTLAILPFEDSVGGEDSHSEELEKARKKLLQTLYDKGVVRVIEIDRIEALIGEKTTEIDSYLSAVKTLQVDTVLTVILKKVDSTEKWLSRKRTTVHLAAHWNGLSTGEILYMGDVSGSSSSKGDGDSAKKERFREALDKALHALVRQLSRKAKDL